MSDLISVSSLLRNSAQIEFQHNDSAPARYIAVKAVELEQRFNSVDTSEVVRCGRCMHWVSPEENDAHYCNHPRGLLGIVAEEDYCSYGERKAGDEDNE